MGITDRQTRHAAIQGIPDAVFHLARNAPAMAKNMWLQLDNDKVENATACQLLRRKHCSAKRGI